MADLTHRVDCHATGIPAKVAVIAKDNLEPLNLCAHCIRRHREHLATSGWVIEELRVPVTA